MITKPDYTNHLQAVYNFAEKLPGKTPLERAKALAMLAGAYLEAVERLEARTAAHNEKLTHLPAGRDTSARPG